MAGYTRQSAASIVPNQDINAGPLNAEFNQLQTAFDVSAGHRHDGSQGSGPRIDLTTSVTGVLPTENGGYIIKDNFVGTTAPGTGNDSLQGYSVGSFWIDTVADLIYICVDSAVGAAIWKAVLTRTNSLFALSSLTPAANQLPYFTGTTTAALTPFSVFARTLLDDTDASSARTTLGLGPLSTTTQVGIANGGTGATTASGARTNLGLGTLSTQNSNSVVITGGNIAGVGLASSNVNIDGGVIGGVTFSSSAVNIGGGTIGNVNFSSSNVNIGGGLITGITDLAVADGGTGASTASQARINLGLERTWTRSTVNAITLSDGVNTTLSHTHSDGTNNWLINSTTFRPAAGVYRICGNFLWDTTTATLMKLKLLKNGSNFMEVDFNTNRSGGLSSPINLIDNATGTTTYEFVALQSSVGGTSLNLVTGFSSHITFEAI